VKLTATKTNLVNTLTIAARVASSSSAIQAAHGVLINTDGSGAVISATDLDTSISLPLVTESLQGPGRVLLPSRLLLDVVKSCPGPSITISFGLDNQAHIESGSARFDLRTLILDDFPPLPQPNPRTVSKLPLAPFVAAIDKVADSASRDETRPVLTGINIRVAGANIRAVATDSYRLAVYRGTLEAPAERDFQLTLPATALQELARLSKVAGDQDLSISESGHNFVMQFASITLSTRTIDGQFPDPDHLIPTECEFSFTYSADTLGQTLKRVGLLCHKAAPAVLTFNGIGLKCHAAATDVGSAEEVLADIVHEGSPLAIGLNPDFLTAALAQYAGGDVEVRLISPLRPVVLTDSSGSLWQILMPIRINTPTEA
jgi:DNA polymerase-3 subunit beta